MEELKPCPRCGAKAYLSRDVVDGFYFGWSAGCPRYCHYDDFNPHFRKGSDGTQENVWI